MLDMAEHWLDGVEVRAVRRQVVQVDALGPQRRQRRLHDRAPVNIGVIQDDNQRPRQRRQGVPEAYHLLGDEAPRLGDPVESGRCAGRHQQSQRSQPAALRVLVWHPLAPTLADPGVGHRLAGTEAAFVERREDEPARGGFF